MHCINKVVLRFTNKNINFNVFFFFPQTLFPRVNPESWAWPWSPVTTWYPSRWRLTVWRTHKDLEQTIDDASPCLEEEAQRSVWLNPTQPDVRPRQSSEENGRLDCVDFLSVTSPIQMQKSCCVSVLDLAIPFICEEVSFCSDGCTIQHVWSVGVGVWGNSSYMCQKGVSV